MLLDYYKPHILGWCMICTPSPWGNGRSGTKNRYSKDTPDSSRPSTLSKSRAGRASIQGGKKNIFCYCCNAGNWSSRMICRPNCHFRVASSSHSHILCRCRSRSTCSWPLDKPSTVSRWECTPRGRSSSQLERNRPRILSPSTEGTRSVLLDFWSSLIRRSDRVQWILSRSGNSHRCKARTSPLGDSCHWSRWDNFPEHRRWDTSWSNSFNIYFSC